ncbi:MAG: hypothetical protein WCI94_14460 [Rhodospirillales bacterium]
MSPFFVGWNLRSILPSAGFLASVCAMTLALFCGLALALGVAIDDPGGGDFSGDKDLTGIVVAEPYPLLVLDPDAAHPNGHTILLSGGGKVGVQETAAALNGKRARATGAGVKRGSIDAMVGVDLQPAEGPAPTPVATPLGIWRLTGEICDGKCVSGVMRPGNGLAHKACANVCIASGVPPVFVTTSPVEGTGFLLMGDKNGHALPDAFRDRTGILQQMDGTVERLGDLLIFRTDFAAATP